MKYLVTAVPRNPLTQEVFAENAAAALKAALENPNRWKIPTPDHESVDWEYRMVPVLEPAVGKDGA